MKGLTLNRLKEMLNYNPETGLFTRNFQIAGNVVGSVAGNKNNKGYVRTNIDTKSYLCHRLAWFYFYGNPPSNLIDHINGDKSDNRIVNLRDVSNSVNCQNKRKAVPRNKLGVLGVHYDKKGNKYRAQIQVNGRVTNLGGYETPELAHQAYIDAKRKLHSGCTI